MKTNEVKAVETVVTPNVDSVIGEMVKKTPEGSVFLDELEKQVKLPRHELLEQIRKVKTGSLIVGRKGKKSRFQWPPIEKAKKTQKRSVAKIETPKEEGGYKLRVSIAGHSIDLDVDTKLIAA